MHDFGLWEGAGLMMIMMILFWGIVFLIVTSAFQTSTEDSQSQPFVKVKRSPLKLVQERYSRGEISREEYISILNDLEDMEEIR